MKASDLKGKTIGFLASGGLDSCTVVHWLTSKGVRVVTFTADLGQPDEVSLDDVAKRMTACGAVEAVVVDLREKMAEAGMKAIQAQARYEGEYWNTTPLGRYVTLEGILPHLIDREITVMSHGATGRGNDQVRFQLITNMLTPDVEVYAPWRDDEFLAELGGREDMLAYCAANGVPIKPPRISKYSTDANILGLSHEAGELESLDTAANFVSPEMGVRPVDAPDVPENVAITFFKGRPTAINGESFTGLAHLFEEANQIAGRNAVGINTHMVENRIVGTKSRGIYEAPGMQLLGQAYFYMLQLVLDRRSRRLFDFCSGYYAEQIYNGYGEDTGSQLASDVIGQIASMVNGTVTVEIYKGSLQFVGMSETSHSLYVEANASMSDVEGFDHQDSEGFLRVLGIGSRALALNGQVANRIA